MIGPHFAEVLDAARGGDADAFASIWRDLDPPLTRYLRTFAPREADDLAAEAWTTVARRLDRFVGDETAFRSWVFVTARRRAVDHFRRERRRPAVPVDPDRLRDAVVAPRNASDDVFDRFATEEALALVATLPRDQAQVVALRAIAGLDVGQVAELVGKRPGTVRVLAHRGLRTLAGTLTGSLAGSLTPRSTPRPRPARP